MYGPRTDFHLLQVNSSAPTHPRAPSTALLTVCNECVHLLTHLQEDGALPAGSSPCLPARGDRPTRPSRLQTAALPSKSQALLCWFHCMWDVGCGDCG